MKMKKRVLPALLLSVFAGAMAVLNPRRRVLPRDSGFRDRQPVLACDLEPSLHAFSTSASA